MTSSFAPIAVRPNYFRLFPKKSNGALFRLGEAAMRMVFKRVKPGMIDIGDLRRHVLTWDERLGRRACNPNDTITPVVCDDVAAEWLDVQGVDSERVILYLHGGAFVLKFPFTQRAMVARWCRALNARALMVAYRLAPEHPFPAAPDDCFAVYRWLLDQGYDPSQIVIAGESAGGNLTLVTLLRARDAGLPMPGCAIVISPAADFSMTGRSAVINENVDSMFSVSLLRWFAEMYLTDMDKYLDPGLSPLVGDFEGLPPMLLQVGGAEMLLDDATRVAAKAHAIGITVRLDVFEGMPHVFQAMPNLIETQEADESLVEFVSLHMGWTNSLNRNRQQEPAPAKRFRLIGLLSGA